VQSDDLAVPAATGKVGAGIRRGPYDMISGEESLACVVGVIELGDAQDLGALGATLALELLVLLELGPVDDLVHDARLLDRLEELVRGDTVRREGARPAPEDATMSNPPPQSSSQAWADLVVRVSLVCESKAGFSMSALT
jgi:hypothetical protein